MSIKPLHTVTLSLPVIVEVAAGDSSKNVAGRAIFLSGQPWVQTVRGDDVKRRLRTIFKPGEIHLYAGVLQLKQALDVGDELAIQIASGKIREFVRVPNQTLVINVAAKKAEMKREGINWGYSGFLNFSRLVAQMIEKARLVMWFSERDGRILPALYCPDWITAAYLIGVMGRMQVCGNPKCNEVFVPTNEKQEYCTPAHGVAYRTARSRWNAKQKKKG